MFLKLLTAIVLLLAVLYMLSGGRKRRLPRAATRVPSRLPPADDLVKCVECGVYLPGDQRCDCK